MPYNSWPWPEHYDQEENVARQNKVKHLCLVCKSYLGTRPEDEEKSFHCKECRCWYTWFPGVDKPISKLDRDMPNPCNCVGCKARRGEVD